jgi:hypothetical protein
MERITLSNAVGFFKKACSLRGVLSLKLDELEVYHNAGYGDETCFVSQVKRRDRYLRGQGREDAYVHICTRADARDAATVLFARESIEYVVRRYREI